jgi:hypothetical protein
LKFLLVGAVLLLLLIPFPVGANAPHPEANAASGVLLIGPLVAHPFHGFWAVVLNGGNLRNTSLAAAFNATPFVLIRYGAGIDATNISGDCTYSSSGVCRPADMNYHDFKVFCGWVHCKAILGVPAETNDPGLAAETVRYVEQTVGFRPTFWSIGNEPSGWKHFGIPFTSWDPSDSSTPTAVQYGQETVNMTNAIRSVDPKARIIGDQDAQLGNAHSFLNNVSRLDGSNLSALAFHSYPERNGPANPTVAQFLSPSNVTRTLVYYRGDVAAANAGCGCSLSMMVGEFNGGFGGTVAPYLQGFADVPMTAAVAAQMLTENASSFGFFSFTGSMPWDLVNMTTGAGTPTYRLYSELLTYLPMGSTYRANVTTTMPGVYAVAERDNQSQLGILIVNTNTQTRLNLSLGGLLLKAGGTIVTDIRSSGITNVTYPAGQGPLAITLYAEEVALLLPGATSGLSGLVPGAARLGDAGWTNGSADGTINGTVNGTIHDAFDSISSSGRITGTPPPGASARAGTLMGPAESSPLPYGPAGSAAAAGILVAAVGSVLLGGRTAKTRSPPH